MHKDEKSTPTTERQIESLKHSPKLPARKLGHLRAKSLCCLPSKRLNIRIAKLKTECPNIQDPNYPPC